MCPVTAAQDDRDAPAHIIAAARQALPVLTGDPPWKHALLTDIKTTALGCRLLRGLELPDPIEVYRLETQLGQLQTIIHISSDGTMTQRCDENTPNLGDGLTLAIEAGSSANRDRDGDTLLDNADACPTIAGLANAGRPGCPQARPGDRDGDGVADSADYCPRQAGSAFADGCSLFADADGDGVPDADDICQHDFGIFREDFAPGCPADGSGSSARRRKPDQTCGIRDRALKLYDLPSRPANLIGTFENTDAGDVIGRDAEGAWYQLTSGWAAAADVQLRGACYNIPLVNPAPGANTGCYLRPRDNSVNVRQAPRGKQLMQIHPENSFTALGRNTIGDWIFFRRGWVSLSTLELSGTCENLPVLDPNRVSSGTVFFCPPEYQGFLEPRINVGKTNARVASSTLANRLRAGPELNAQLIGEIAPGTILDAILDGPACNGAFVWWQVETGGRVGWTVESDLNANYYYLEPVAVAEEPGADTPVKAAALPSDQALNTTLQLINSANAQRVNTLVTLPAEDPYTLAWSPSQSWLLSLGASGTLNLFGYPGFDSLQGIPILPVDLEPTAIAISSDDILAVGGVHGRISLVRIVPDSQADPLTISQPGAAPVRGLDWSDDGKRLAAISNAPESKIAGSAGWLGIWDIGANEAMLTAEAALQLAFTYPLSDLAFSSDGRWLAVIGESDAKRRAALWVYDMTDGQLVYSKALVFMQGAGLIRASPDSLLGDFVYNNGDSLYFLDLDERLDRQLFQRVGSLLSQVDIRRRVIPGAEILLAVGSLNADGAMRLSLVNALNGESPPAAWQLQAASFAFSPDGRALALAQPNQDRIMIFGVSDR